MNHLGIQQEARPPMAKPVLDLVAEPTMPMPHQGEVADQPLASVENADNRLDCLSFYQFFLRRLQGLAAKTPATDQELLERLDIGKPQFQEWLKRAMAEGQVKKLNKPVRYQWQTTRLEQDSFFTHSS